MASSGNTTIDFATFTKLVMDELPSELHRQMYRLILYERQIGSTKSSSFLQPETSVRAIDTSYDGEDDSAACSSLSKEEAKARWLESERRRISLQKSQEEQIRQIQIARARVRLQRKAERVNRIQQKSVRK